MSEANSKYYPAVSVARAYIEKLPEVDKAKVLASIKIMETDFDTVYSKLLRSPIRELVVKKYRLLFFINKNVIY